jgi:hypothetical protein
MMMMMMMMMIINITSLRNAFAANGPLIVIIMKFVITTMTYDNHDKFFYIELYFACNDHCHTHTCSFYVLISEVNPGGGSCGGGACCWAFATAASLYCRCSCCFFIVIIIMTWSLLSLSLFYRYIYIYISGMTAS